MKVILILIFFSFNFFCKAQVKVSIDDIKSDSISIDPNFRSIIQRPNGWKWYAKYFFKNDSLGIYPDSEQTITKFRTNGVVQDVHEGIKDDVSLFYNKYKITDSSYCFKFSRENWREIKRHKAYPPSSKRIWYCDRIIKVTDNYFIIESIDNKNAKGRTRNILIAN